MKDQHKLIDGYRELTIEEIDYLNVVKSKEKDILELIWLLETVDPEYPAQPDRRWLAIAKTDLQKGFMALCRSIAKPHES